MDGLKYIPAIKGIDDCNYNYDSDDAPILLQTSETYINANKYGFQRCEMNLMSSGNLNV